MCANSMVKLYRLTRAREKKLRPRETPRDSDKCFIPYPGLPRLLEYLERYPADDVRTTANLWNDGVSMVEEDRHSTPYFYEVLYENIVANPEREILEILKFCELPAVDRSNRPFWNQIRGVGVVRHTNRYGNFALIEKICRNPMKRYGYLPG